MNKDEAKALFEQVRENSRKLNSCKLHDFSEDLTPGQEWGKKYRCSKCGGEISEIPQKYWYEKGLQHAREALSEDVELANIYRGLLK